MKRFEEASKLLYDALGVRNSSKMQSVQKKYPEETRMKMVCCNCVILR